MNAPEKITPEETQATSFELIKLTQLHPSPTNPRHSFAEDKLQELAATIADHGVIEPIVVRPWPDGQQQESAWRGKEVKYEIVSGERRFRASRIAGAETIPALIRHLTDNQVLEIQVIENLQREEVHPIEEAEGYQILMQRTKCSAEELAAKVGKSKAYIYARLKLTALCDAAREAFREDKLSASTALLIARIPGKKLQEDALEAITDGYGDEPFSYRDAQNHIQQYFMLRLREAPFDLDWEDLPRITSCAACPRRSGNQPELFADIESADVCTDPPCFNKKREAWAEQKRSQAEQLGVEVITGKSAEQIVPQYLVDLRYLRGGYLAIDTRCEAAEPVRPVPEEPTEPEGEPEDNEPAWDAYNEAYDKWEEARHEALPTYRELLEGEEIKRVMVQHPKSGDLIECVKRDEAETLLIAMKKIPQPMLAKSAPASSASHSSGGSDHKVKEQKAKAETEYREALLKQVLAQHAGQPLTEDDLRTIALGMWESANYDHKELLCRIFNGTDTDEALEAMENAIASAGADDINRLLLALSLVEEVKVNWWQDPSQNPCELLLGAAERFGIDAAAVRRQMEAPAAPKKAKATPKAKVKAETKTETAPELPAEPVTTLAIGDKVRIKADAKGPNGRKRKCAGREGFIDDISEDGAYYTVRFEPKGSALAIVTNLARDEFEKVEA